MSAAADFLRARDFLLAHRTDYATARRDFRWPAPRAFNWALDYFDVIAAGNDDPALWIVEESGDEQRLSFSALAARSNQVANWLHAQGERRHDRVLLMLGNEVALWETVLAAMKLGAVVIPANSFLTREDVCDRLARGRVDHVVVQSGSAARSRCSSVAVSRPCARRRPYGAC